MTDLIPRAAVLEILRTPAAVDTFPDMIRRVEALEGGVRVKPLEWEYRKDMPGLHNAQSAIGWWFNIFELCDGRFKYDGDPMSGLAAIPQAFPTLEAAKAAAQADYTARIMAALQSE